MDIANNSSDSGVNRWGNRSDYWEVLITSLPQLYYTYSFEIMLELLGRLLVLSALIKLLYAMYLRNKGE